METIKAREVLHYTLDQIDALLPGDYLVQFDDQTIALTRERLIFSWFLWPFQRAYAQAPLCIRHCIQNQDIEKKTTINLLTAGFYDAFDALGKVRKLVPELEHMAYAATSALVNYTGARCNRYVYTVDHRDYREIVNLPTVQRQLKVLREPDILRTERLRRIDETYSLVSDEIRMNPTLDLNPVADSMRANYTSALQVLQITVMRGNVTDRNGDIFPYPVLRGYLACFRTLHDQAVCSREATKALDYQKGLLKAVEYINRKFQLVGSAIHTVHEGDCGTTEFLTELVTQDVLKSHDGKYFRLAGSQEGFDQVVTPDRKDLVGKTIEFRTAWGCKHPDPLGICSKCFGELFYQIPEGDNIGHDANVNVNHKGAQITLSTKHLDWNAASDELVLSQTAQRYLTIVESTQHIMLTSRLKGSTIKLQFSTDQAPELVSVEKATDFYSIKPQEVSQLTTVRLIVTDKDGLTEEANLEVHSGNRSASFTLDALKYIQAHGAQTLAFGSKEIDLTEWDFSQSLFELPMRQSNMLDYMNQLENILKSTKDNSKRRKRRGSLDRLTDFENPVDALRYFNKVLRTKLHVNFAFVEIIVMAYRVIDPEKGNYYPAKGLTTGTMVSRNDVLRYRSFSVPMAFERHRDYLESPISFTATHRPPSILDPYLMGSLPPEK